MKHASYSHLVVASLFELSTILRLYLLSKGFDMPRKPRMFIPGIPCHVIQRGNNRSVCFYEEENYLFYLDCLSDACRRFDVELHAYVLMTNHVHLLMTPSTEVGIS